MHFLSGNLLTHSHRSMGDKLRDEQVSTYFHYAGQMSDKESLCYVIGVGEYQSLYMLKIGVKLCQRMTLHPGYYSKHALTNGTKLNQTSHLR